MLCTRHLSCTQENTSCSNVLFCLLREGLCQTLCSSFPGLLCCWWDNQVSTKAPASRNALGKCTGIKKVCWIPPESYDCLTICAKVFLSSQKHEHRTLHAPQISSRWWRCYKCICRGIGCLQSRKIFKLHPDVVFCAQTLLNCFLSCYTCKPFFLCLFRFFLEFFLFLLYS